ncbi:AAA family ATPase [Vibrio vulnificus]
MNELMTLSLNGYKAIGEEQDLPLTKLSILSGCNSGGKSSFMQVLLMMKQTIESSYSDGALLINGEHVKHNSVSSMLSVMGSGKKSQTIEFTYRNKSGKDRVTVCYKKNRSGLEPVSILLKNREFEELIINKNKKAPADFEEHLPEHVKNFMGAFGKKGRWKVVTKNCFLELRWVPNKNEQIGFSTGITPGSKIEDLCKKLIHLPGLRGNPERMYKKLPVGNVYYGTFEKYTASILSKWASTKRQRKNITILEGYLKTLGLCQYVETQKIDDTNFEILVSRLPVSESSVKNKNNLVNIADVGFGVSQTLPILVALVAAKEGQIVYIEQPEIHLHPNAQWHFAKILSDSISRGVIVVIETHSSILIRGIQTLVARGEIKDGNDVSLHWFSRNKETGVASISSSSLDEMGAFGDWPADFDDIALRAEQEYLDAVEARFSEEYEVVDA